VILGLAAVLAGGSLYGLLVLKEGGGRRAEAGEAAALPGKAPPADAPLGEGIFTGIGRIRVSAGETEPLTVVLSISFPYFPGDKAFSEELASKVREFRSISADFIASLSEEELWRQDEEAIKGELLRRYNRILRLGRIESLYFSDFMVIN
jgi:flagellar basal body-associated protein FliL